MAQDDVWCQVAAQQAAKQDSCSDGPESCSSFAFVGRLVRVRAATGVRGSVGRHLRRRLESWIVVVTWCTMLVMREMVSLVRTRGEVRLLLGIATPTWTH